MLLLEYLIMCLKELDNDTEMVVLCKSGGLPHGRCVSISSYRHANDVSGSLEVQVAGC